MPLSKEQTKQVKEQLLAQIEKGFPDERKEYAKKQILEMDAKQLEEFLKTNNLTASTQKGDKSQCIFCSIIDGKLPSYKIAENTHAIAVLDIRPASKGHTLIIPKEHIESEGKLSKEVKKLAEEVSKHLKKKLNSDKVKQENTNLFGHEVINLVPVYEGEKPKPLDSQREEADEKELLELQGKLKLSQKPKKADKQPKTKKVRKSEKLRLPRRIP